MDSENLPVYTQMLTFDETADLLEISRRTLQRWCCRGSFPIPVTLSRGVVRFPVSTVISWLENQLAAVDAAIDEYCNSPP